MRIGRRAMREMPRTAALVAGLVAIGAMFSCDDDDPPPNNPGGAGGIDDATGGLGGIPNDQGGDDFGGSGGRGGCDSGCGAAQPHCDEATDTCVECLEVAHCPMDNDQCTTEACTDHECTSSYAGGAVCAPQWVRRFTPTSPPNLLWAAAAYHPGSDTVIVFGGQADGSMRDTTWSFDGFNWTQLNPSTRPSARWAHGMAFYPTVNNIVLFGGLETEFGTNGLDDTWVWNGVTWVEVQPTTRPPGRAVNRNMAFDPTLNQMIIFGGGTQPSQPTLDDAWAFDTNTWTELVLPTAPSARIAACMVRDPVNDRALLFGGGQWTDPYNSDTWSFQALTVTNLSPTTSPPPLQAANCAWDPWRERFVVQGGAITQVPVELTNATWELDPTGWQSVTSTPQPPANCCGVMAEAPGGRGVMLLTNGETWILDAPAVPR